MMKKETNPSLKEENINDNKRPLDSFFVLQKRKGLVFANREIVGVDIGSSHIKVVQIDIKKLPAVIRGIHIEEIPIDKRDRGEVTEIYIIKKLRSIVKKAKLKNSLAVSFVSGNSVVVHSCTIPETAENEIVDAIKMDASKDLAFSTDESFLGYSIIGKTTGRKGQELEIAAVFAHKDVVNRKIWLLEQSGLQAAGITVLPFAYENIFSTNIEETPENMVIITIGEETTGIDFFRNGTFMFTREVSASGKDINKAFSGVVNTPEKKVEISIEEAEVIKRKYGVVLDQSVHKENLVLNQLVAKSRSTYEKMATEIKRSLGYFMRMTKISSLDAVYICGGGANTKNIVQFFKEQLEISIEPFPFKKYFKVSPVVNEKLEAEPSNLSFVLPSCGLALEELNAKINLVPKVTRMISKIASFKSVYNFALFMLYMIFISLFAYIKFFTVKDFESTINRLNANFKNISEQNQQVETFNRYKNKVNRKKKVLNTLIGTRPLWHGVLKEISHIVPDNVYLEKISFEYEKETKIINVNISGEIYRGKKSVDFTVSQLSLDMKNSSYFTKVNLENINTKYKRGSTQTLFSINAELLY